MATQTASYSFNKPTVGADTNVWGGLLNDNWDDVDDLLDGTAPIDGVDIDGGSIDGTPVGASEAETGAFTDLSATGDVDFSNINNLSTLQLDLELVPQSSPTDTTADRLMTVGAFGLGATTLTLISDIDDTSLAQGNYRFANTASGTFPGAPTYGVLSVYPRAGTAGGIYQVFMRFDNFELWSRVYNGSSWGTWRPISPDTSSGANGRYTKFASGLMICTRECSVDVTSTALQSFNWAASFTAEPQTYFTQLTTITNSALRLSNFQGVSGSTTHANIRLLAAGTSSDPSANSEKLYAFGIGQWI